ncbi:MAG: glycoside hydrolase family 38 C-terminal domain-containing protein [Hespellia sp.]|nr:glycoside hydrolase family 38 C-terminal domain-containing protein [Hespellia sp.]
MNKRKTGYVIPHTHWDREWRYPIWENRLYLRDLMEELTETLEKQEGYKSFLLDGQVVAVHDYLEVCPKERERIEKLICEKRIQIGPWYTLPDLYPISGESIVRNLLKGKKEAEKLGGYLKIGYESFGWGQPSQLPQIYKGFDIDTVIISKNVDKTKAPRSEFKWIGADGTEVLATRLGEDARANFFMNAYLEIMTGKAYKTEEYEYHYGQDGQVYHQADKKQYIQDYFRMENTEYIHGEKVRESVQKAWDGMNASWLEDDRAMMDGTDSTTAQPLLMELLSEINQQCETIDFKNSSIEEYVQILKEKLPMDQLLEIHGEMRDGPTTSLSGNALMTRPHIKTLNKQVQSQLFAQAEPVSSVLYMSGERYESHFLEKAMDYLLLSHPHDSINGVTQDKTVEDVLYRLSQAGEIAELVYNRGIQHIIRRIDFSKYEKDDILFVVFNPSAKPRKEVLKVYLDTPREQNIWDFKIVDSEGIEREMQEIERTEAVSPVVHLHSRPFPYYTDRHAVWVETGEVPAGGYQVYALTECSKYNRKTKFWAKTRKTKGEEIGFGCDEMDNGILNVKVNQDGSLTVQDQRNGEMYGPLNYYESTGDVGDYWMYYPPYNNSTYTTRGLQAEIRMTDNGNLSATIAAEITMKLPKFAYRPENYIHGKSCRSEEKETVQITTYYTLKKGSSQVEVDVKLDNRCRDHRMSVIMDSDVHTETIDAEGHFVVDHRDALPLKDSEGAYFNELTTQPMQDFVSVYDGTRGLGVVTDCLGEYELRKSKALAFTLFRAVRNIICTEFRSEGYFPDQDGGQLQRELEYHYAIAPQNGTYEEEKMADRAEQFKVALKPVQTNVPNVAHGSLPLKHSFYEVKGNVSVSCFKKAENGEAVILRMFNLSGSDEMTVVKFAAAIKSACIVDLKEDMVEEVKIEENQITAVIGTNKICTLKIVF